MPNFKKMILDCLVKGIHTHAHKDGNNYFCHQLLEESKKNNFFFPFYILLNIRNLRLFYDQKEKEYLHL